MLPSDQMPGLLLALVDLPQMYLYLARRNQGFAGVFLCQLPFLTELLKHDYSRMCVLLDTKGYKSKEELLYASRNGLYSFFFYYFFFPKTQGSEIFLASSCQVIALGTFTSCFEQLYLNSLNCTKMMTLVQEHDCFSFPSIFSECLFKT